MFFGLITLISATYIIFNKSNEKEEKKTTFYVPQFGFPPIPPSSASINIRRHPALRAFR